jgi:hypothetical protein
MFQLRPLDDALSLSLSLSLSRARARALSLSFLRACSLSLSLCLSHAHNQHRRASYRVKGAASHTATLTAVLDCAQDATTTGPLSRARTRSLARAHTQTLSCALSRWRARSLSGVRALSRLCCLHALSGPLRALARISQSHDLSFSVAFSLALSSISFFVVVHNMIRYTT